MGTKKTFLLVFLVASASAIIIEYIHMVGLRGILSPLCSGFLASCALYLCYFLTGTKDAYKKILQEEQDAQWMKEEAYLFRYAFLYVNILTFYSFFVL